MRRHALCFVITFVLLSTSVVVADPFQGSLTFMGLHGGDPVGDYYQAYGITFTGFTAVAGHYYSCQGTMDTCSASVSNGAIMDVTPGFMNALSFYFFQGSSGDVLLYDGLDGTGNLLGEMSLGPAINEWEPFGFTFNGLAKSAVFNGGMEVAVLTMGGGLVLPEPGTLTLCVSALAGLALSRARRR